MAIKPAARLNPEPGLEPGPVPGPRTRARPGMVTKVEAGIGSGAETQFGAGARAEVGAGRWERDELLKWVRTGEYKGKNTGPPASGTGSSGRQTGVALRRQYIVACSGTVATGDQAFCVSYPGRRHLLHRKGTLNHIEQAPIRKPVCYPAETFRTHYGCDLINRALKVHEPGGPLTWAIP